MWVSQLHLVFVQKVFGNSALYGLAILQLQRETKRENIEKTVGKIIQV
jgi:hypothetical protein